PFARGPAPGGFRRRLRPPRCGAWPGAATRRSTAYRLRYPPAWRCLPVRLAPTTATNQAGPQTPEGPGVAQAVPTGVMVGTVAGSDGVPVRTPAASALQDTGVPVECVGLGGAGAG